LDRYIPLIFDLHAGIIDLVHVWVEIPNGLSQVGNLANLACTAETFCSQIWMLVSSYVSDTCMMDFEPLINNAGFLGVRYSNTYLHDVHPQPVPCSV
jgi:hypothetical protein